MQPGGLEKAVSRKINELVELLEAAGIDPDDISIRVEFDNNLLANDTWIIQQAALAGGLSWLPLRAD